MQNSDINTKENKINEDLLERNLRVMDVVEKELNKRKTDSIFCLSAFLVTMALWVLVVALWEMLGRPIAPSTMTYGVEIISIVMFLIMKIKTGFKWEMLGISLRNFKQTMLRAITISIIIIVVIVTFKLITRPGEALFDWSKYILTYPITCILQEFLARGFLLSMMINIYDKKRANFLAVILSSLLFTTLHLYYGFIYMIGAGILSIILGCIYLKDRNIWGVSLIHFVLGTLGTVTSLL